MNKYFQYTVWLIMAVPVLYLAIVWNRLPEQVTMHFDWTGKPDRLGSKKELLTLCIVLTVLNPVLYLLLSNIYRIDPKKYAAENRSRLRILAYGLVLFLSALLCLIIYSSSQGNIRFNTGLVLAGTGLLFAFIGNYIHNIKPNYFAGLRLPWTLESGENWRKTHALAGKLWFAGGLFLAVACLFLAPNAAWILFIVTMSIITLWPCIYSYRLYREKKRKTSTP